MFLKIILGLSLLGFSAMRQEGMDEREAEDSVNDYGRSAVGESKEETVRLSLSFPPSLLPSLSRVSLIKSLGVQPSNKRISLQNGR